MFATGRDGRSLLGASTGEMTFLTGTTLAKVRLLYRALETFD